MQALVWSTGWGEHELRAVRWMTPEEREKFVSEVRERGMYGVEGETVKLPLAVVNNPALKQVMSRKGDGWLPGTNTVVWLLTDEEASAIRQLIAAHEAATQPVIPVESEPLPADVLVLLKRYRTSEEAWDAGDESAWARLRQYDC
jgi:hypothetical protein